MHINWLSVVAFAVSLHGSSCLGSLCYVADNITHSLYGQDVTFNWSSSEAPLASRWMKNNVAMMYRVSNGEVTYESGYTADKVWPIDDTAFTLARITTEDNALYTCSHVPVGSSVYVLKAQSQLQVHIVSVDDLVPNLRVNTTEINSELSVDSRNEQTLSSSAPMNDPACVNVLIKLVAVPAVYETLHNDNTVSTEAVGQQDILDHPEYANMN